MDELKPLFALGLPAHDATGRLSFTPPLPVSMGSRRSHEFHYVLPGRACSSFCHELIQVWPELDQHRVDHRTRSIQQTQRISLGRVWQAKVMA